MCKTLLSSSQNYIANSRILKQILSFRIIARNESLQTFDNWQGDVPFHTVIAATDDERNLALASRLLTPLIIGHFSC